MTSKELHPEPDRNRSFMNSTPVTAQTILQPIILGPNQPADRFYAGGHRIADLRGLSDTRTHVPEDWVASTTSLFGDAGTGLSRLPNGELLRDTITSDPVGWLGHEHVERFGSDPTLLVKLLDAGQRLPVHVHPDDGFARRHLACPYGKTEGWVIVEAEPGATVHFGFTRDVTQEQVRRWVDQQDTAAMLAAMHAVPVHPGDGVLVPAGMVHAIGSGILLIELQQPSDLSVLMEWKGFEIDGRIDGHLGIGFDTALACVDRRATTPERLTALRTAATAVASERPFPAEADRFFRADRLRVRARTRLEAGFAVLVVLDGGGILRTEGGHETELSRGMTIVVPYGAGSLEVTGGQDMIRCRPPQS
jgi:mannose-6-phosphate isomerase